MSTRQRSIPLIIILTLTLPLLIGLSQDQEQGKFIYQRNDQLFAEENYTLERFDGDRIKVTSEFKMHSKELVREYVPSGSLRQVFMLNLDFDLLSYLFQVDTSEGALHVQVDIKNGEAIIKTLFTYPSGKTDKITNHAPIGDRFIFSQVSAVQLMILHKVIHQIPELRASDQEITLKALYPVDPLNPELKRVAIQKNSPTLLAKGSEIINAQRYRIKVSSFHQDTDITLRMYSDEEKLLGFEFSTQPRILVYRADLFPHGFFNMATIK